MAFNPGGSLVVRGGLDVPGAERHAVVYGGQPGYSVRFQPDNASALNAPTLQGVASYVNANDFNPVAKGMLFDRKPVQQCFLPSIDVRNYQYTPLDTNKNMYNPRRFPDPMCTMTAYPSRRLRPAPMNGSSNPYNPPNPFGMPPSGTNNVAFIVTAGL